MGRKLKNLAKEMVESVKKVKPDAKLSPLNAILGSLDALTRLDGRSIPKIKDVFSWAISDGFWKSKLIKPNPAKYLREKFDGLEIQMLEKPGKKERKFAPASRDDVALRNIQSMRKGAL